MKAGITTTFLKESMNGTTFDLSSGTSAVFKCALYTADATIDYATTAYSSTNEVSGTGYTAGGATLTIATNPTIDGRTVYATFATLTFSTVTLSSIRYALIYMEDGVSDYSVVAIDLEDEYSASAQDFVLTFPADLIKRVSGK